MRYYANPAAPDPLKDVKIGKLMFVPTHVMAPPRGDGCLVVYQEGTIQRAAWLTR
jgi:hypothetical protein